MATRTAHPASLCGGRFEVRRVLGSGAYGEVYEAYDRAREAHVALKRLTKLNPEALLRFKREFRAAAEVQHENLVHLEELFEDQGEWMFTMELVQGIGFLEYVRPDESYNEERLRHATAQLAEGLMALHGAGRVHRDVKPSNIRVTPQGRVVLLDLGLVTELDTDRALTGVVGTPAYMAPEQARSANITPAADWYSVGVLLYEALTGARPFDGSSLVLMVHKQSASPSRPSERTGTVPDDLDGLCVALLAADPDERPGGRDVLQVLGRRGRRMSQPPEAPPPSSGQFWIEGDTQFVGRGRELGALQGMREHASSGRLAVVHVHGESGVGKSALLHTFVRAARNRDPRTVVLRGTCPLRESVPYKAFDGIIDSLAQKMGAIDPVVAGAVVPRRVGSLVRMFPVLASADSLAAPAVKPRLTPPANLRDEGRAALRELLERLGSYLPLVVILDDLQWADPDSLELLRGLVEPPDPPALLLLISTRPTDECEPEIRAAVAHALDASESLSMPLGGLDPADARHLAHEMLGPQHASRVDRLVQETGGHPLFLTELAQHARDSVPPGGAAPQLDTVLRTRIDALDETSQRLLRVLGIAAGPLSLQCLFAAAQLEWNSGDRALKGLCLHHLARTLTSRGTLMADTYHARVRAVAHDRLSGTQRRAAHHQLADALLKQSPEAHEDLLLHLTACGRDSEAAQHAAQAGRAAATALAFERAMELFERALSLREDWSEHERRQLLRDLGDACSAAGHGKRAAEAYAKAAEGAQRLEKLELSRHAAEHFLRSGNVDRGLDLSRFVVEALGLPWHEKRSALISSLAWGRLRLGLTRLRYELKHPSQLDPELLVRSDALYWTAEALAAVDTVRSMSLQTASLLIALRSGEPGRIARTFGMAAIWRGMARSGIDERTEQLLTTARKLAEDGDDPRVVPALLYSRGLLHVFAMQPAPAIELTREAGRRFREECVDAENALVMCQINELVALSMLGDMVRLRRQASSYDRRAQTHGNLFAEAMMFLTGGFMSHILDDDVDSGLERNAQLMARWSVRGFQLQHLYALWSEGNLLAYRGGPQARTLFDARWADVKRSGLLRIPFWRIIFASLYARTALIGAMDEPEQRASHLNAAERCVREVLSARKFAGAPTQAGVLRAGIAHVKGDTAQACAELEHALAFLHEHRLGLTEHAVRWQLGRLKGGDEGRVLRTQAQQWADQQEVGDLPRLARLMAPGFD